MRHLGIMNLDIVLLVEMLGLPKGTRVIALRENFDCFSPGGPVLSLKIEHPALPAVSQGSEVKVIRPVFRTEKRDAPVLEKWDIQDEDKI